ncbi:MAG TPA: PP2C family protein-serine/threonine phosphatase, partial [Gammaproteobacteria bacterium]|nr:PP2C family protein-serine/threonine phosphatase [Gammaproteobacteria bacterium]
MSPRNKYLTQPPLDDSYAKKFTLTHQNVPVAAMTSGPGQKAVGEQDGDRLNQDAYLMEHLNPKVLIAWDEVFAETNNTVLESLVAHDQTHNDVGLDLDSGCTALVAHIQNNKLVLANAGDCTAKLVYKTGDTYQVLALTQAHRPSTLCEQTRIQNLRNSPLRISQPQNNDDPRMCLNERNAKCNNGLSITRGFGAEEYVPAFSCIPEVTTIDLNKYGNISVAFLVTASDGFADYVNDEELTDFFNLSDRSSLEGSAENLRKKAYLEKISHDNITVGVHRLHPGLCVGVFDGFGHWGKIAADRAALHLQTIMQRKNLQTEIAQLVMSGTFALIQAAERLKIKLIKTLETHYAQPMADPHQHAAMQLACDAQAMLA